MEPKQYQFLPDIKPGFVGPPRPTPLSYKQQGILAQVVPGSMYRAEQGLLDETRKQINKGLTPQRPMMGIINPWRPNWERIKWLTQPALEAPRPFKPPAPKIRKL